jgi:hypothetical protein
MLKTKNSRQMATEFLNWLAGERNYTIKLFRLISLVEDSLREQWSRDGFAEGEVMSRLAVAIHHREKVETLLNIMDFGDQFKVNFESAARKRLFKKWAQRNSTARQN